ncbi:hypothetical protein L211DRAFT_827985 [Terfezia boudieri ATCC MYA-4762]|uniref:Mediator of RNA polymerase II transcription subunit 11 n=1 Tax=Terfezia boudieri ATCC MYA-4762 TaxID=1051890 RepID=A0A3N4LFL2_9PEZI|nr:hypothetical protein L211DRAFT_827985 [Terfezia boudieri ATCC MYA-4762]
MPNTMDINDPASSPFSFGDGEDVDLPEALALPGHSSQPQAPSQPGKPVDPAIAIANKGIEELNRIDENISALLLSAGLAIKTLTTPTSLLPDPTSTPPNPPITSPITPPTLPTQLSTFKHHASHFHSLLDSIRVSLRRQILLQDQLELLAPTPPSGTTTTTSSSSIANPAPTTAFDIGLLNVRSDNVGKDMEEELWNKARGFVENLERAREAAEAEMQLLGGTRVGGGDGHADGDVDMLSTQSISMGD